MKQKKVLVKVIGITLLSAITIRAFSQEQQTDYENKLTPKFGIKGGVNLTNLYADDVNDEHMKVGGNVGVFAKLPITKGLSIQPEVLYSMKGSQVNYSNLLGDGKYRFNLNYVEVPVLAVINVAKNFNIHAGGYAAFLASAKIKDVDNNGDVNGVKELNKDDFQTFDYGLVGGFGFDISDVTLGARYNYGLKEIGRSGVSGQLVNNAKNSAISLYVGFAF
ncbi:porin family protein [Chitinophagaceae bacterium 26-R-25]|nr:porin family protein [Chitinophagaceae bacterium 26-R-25]